MRPEEIASSAAGEPLTITVEQAAKLLGLGRNAAYAAVRRGEIPSLRFGRLVRVPKAALQRLLEQAARAGAA